MDNQPANEPSGGNMEDESNSGVTVPEAFQQSVHKVMQGATTKAHLSHVRERVSAREDEMRAADEAKASKNKPLRKGVPDTYSTEAMPSH